MVELDHIIFHFINVELANPILDSILIPWRNKYTWFPLYVFIISFILFNSKKNRIYIVVSLVASVGLSDIVSSHLIKKNVERPRPCHIFNSPEEISLKVRCGRGYSFTSSHAANHSCIAFFLVLLLGKRNYRLKVLLLLWAFFVGIAQVYVGVHFPLDILSGFLVGYLIARLGHYALFRLTS